MGAASIFLEARSLVWRRWWAGLAPRCSRSDCVRAHSLWGRLRGQPQGVRLQGGWYCRGQCLELTITAVLERMRIAPKRAMAHRIPLGLLLLSRQQLTEVQLRQALEAQRSAGHGKIGEWLRDLGFVSDLEIITALARQWSCPVLHARSFPSEPGRIPRLPLALLESFGMVPVDYVSSTATLHMAFSERIDYSVLYAIEQMLECRTEPCLVLPGFLRHRLESLSEGCGESEIIFDRIEAAEDAARIVRSYAVCISATEIRLAACGSRLWVRLLRPVHTPLDLLLRIPATMLHAAIL